MGEVAYIDAYVCVYFNLCGRVVMPLMRRELRGRWCLEIRAW